MSDVYDAGLALMAADGVDWADAAQDFRVLLLKNGPGPAFVATHATVSAALATAQNDELTDASYARYTIPDGNRSVVSAARKRQFHISAAADFGALTGETVGAAILFKFVTNDADSIPVVFITSGNFPLVANGAGFTVNDGANGLFEIEGV